jgi:hypothetical protein
MCLWKFIPASMKAKSAATDPGRLVSLPSNLPPRPTASRRSYQSHLLGTVNHLLFTLTRL